jgi:hypothetical protein
LDPQRNDYTGRFVSIAATLAELTGTLSEQTRNSGLASATRCRATDMKDDPL